jgi:NitT/TauT family transport system substrate-binding protein
MFKKILFSLVIVLLFTSCSLENKEKIRISATTWIGYAPLFYAKEKGWLEPLNIKLLNVVSLSENMYLYKAGNADAYVGTQYEYNILADKTNSLIPIILFDKSNGGDVVMGNQTIQELQNLNTSIDVYLEMDSINSILFEEFVKEYNLQTKQFNYINKDQAYISRLSNLENPTIIITYVPYNISLEKNGFKELASTKNNPDLLIVDALFMQKDKFLENKDTFVKLKKLIDESIVDLGKDPKAFFETIKVYLPNTNYEEFLSSLDDIIWLNKDISEKIIEKLSNHNLPTRDIIR